MHGDVSRQALVGIDQQCSTAGGHGVDELSTRFVDHARAPVVDHDVDRRWLPVEAQGAGQCKAGLVVRATLPHPVDHRPHRLHRVGAVPGGDVSDLERGGGRQHHVCVAGRVREHLLVDHGEHVVTRERVDHCLLVGTHHDGVRTLDEQHLARVARIRGHPRSHLMQRQRPPVELIEGRPAPIRSDLGGAGGADDAAAEHAEVTAQHGQRKDCTAGSSAVRIALLTPTEAQHRWACGAPPLGQGGDVGSGEACHVGSPFERPLLAVCQQLFCACCVGVDERTIEVPFRPPVVRDRVREDGVGARSDGEVQVGALGHRRPPRIDDHHLGPAFDGSLNEGWEVGVGDGGIGAPDDHQLGVHHIERVGRTHVAIDAVPRRADGVRADGVLDDRRAERGEEGFGHAVSLHRSRGGVVGERHHSIGPSCLDRLCDASGDDRQSLVPRGFAELGSPFRAGADHRRQHALGRVHAMHVLLDLGADPTVGQGIARRCVDIGDALIAVRVAGDRHCERTRIGAVEGACGVANLRRLADLNLDLLGRVRNELRHRASLADRRWVVQRVALRWHDPRDARPAR